MLIYTALQPLNSWDRVPGGKCGGYTTKCGGYTTKCGGYTTKCGGYTMCKVIIVSNPTPVEVDLRLCWVEVGVLTIWAEQEDKIKQNETKPKY